MLKLLVYVIAAVLVGTVAAAETGRDEKNATVQLTLTQDFFTNFTYEFLAPNLELLPKFLENHNLTFDIMD